jgi:hypothetical protein
VRLLLPLTWNALLGKPHLAPRHRLVLRLHLRSPRRRTCKRHSSTMPITTLPSTVCVR